MWAEGERMMAAQIYLTHITQPRLSLAARLFIINASVMR